MKLHIRWLIRRDYSEVLDIESASFEYPWTEEDLVDALRNRNIIGMVGEIGDRIVAHMLYELWDHNLTLLNLAVHPDMRRRGIGTEMVNKMISKLSFNRRSSIDLLIRESNLDGQLFFRKLGFVAQATHRKWFTINDEDAYEMEYRLGAFQPRNRIAGLMRGHK